MPDPIDAATRAECLRRLNACGVRVGSAHVDLRQPGAGSLTRTTWSALGGSGRASASHKTLPERNGQPCRVLCAGRGPGPRNILVEFADGFKAVSIRYSVRKLAQPSEPGLWEGAR